MCIISTRIKTHLPFRNYSTSSKVQQNDIDFFLAYLSSFKWIHFITTSILGACICYLLSTFFFVFLVCTTPLFTNTEEQDKQSKMSSKPTEPEQSNNWSDVLTYFYNPMKIFSLRQDLPKRLNFAYFWARTRIVQRGIMVS